MIKKLKYYYKVLRKHFFFYHKSNDYNIKLFNYQWDNTFYVPNHWLYQFIHKRNIVKENKTLSIYSVNGERLSLKLNKSDYLLFYTVENVHVPMSHWEKYKDLLLENNRISIF